jgi:hypothetical protein
MITSLRIVGAQAEIRTQLSLSREFLQLEPNRLMEFDNKIPLRLP